MQERGTRRGVNNSPRGREPLVSITELHCFYGGKEELLTHVTFKQEFSDPTGFPDSSVGKESACNAGDPVRFWVGEIPWRRGRLPTPVFLGFPGGSTGKESAGNAGDLGSIPGEGKVTHSRILAWRMPWTG